MASMMQQMMRNPDQMQQAMSLSQELAGGTGSVALSNNVSDEAANSTRAPTTSPGNPMAQMMQQMMSNPALMQQSMTMAQQMFGGGEGYAGQGAPTGAEGTTNAAASPASANPMASMMQQLMGNPAQMQLAAPNPMAASMQQMMSNPDQMQQIMQMSQQLFGGVGFAGGMPTPGIHAPDANGTADALQPMMLNAQRARFSSQLSQLMAMGFTNETVCLRVLAQHNGRVDAALDTLLSMGDSA